MDGNGMVAPAMPRVIPSCIRHDGGLVLVCDPKPSIQSSQYDLNGYFPARN